MRECLEKCLLALELLLRANDLAAEAAAHQMAGNSLLMSGNPEPARYHASAAMVPAQKVGDHFSTLNGGAALPCMLFALPKLVLCGGYVAGVDDGFLG